MDRLRFDIDDGDGFEAARDQLLDEYTRWLRRTRGPTDHDLADDAQTFLDWRFGSSSGELDRYTPEDLREFFLEWCPRRLSAPPEIIGDLSRAVSGFVEFMASTDRLEGGAGAAAQLIVTAEELVPEAFTAMGDPSNFGMAKSLFGQALSDELASAGSEDEMQAILERAMTEFNALPDAERRTATDRFFEPPSTLRELPFIHIAPDADEVATSAAAAPVLASFRRARDLLGDGTGRSGRSDTGGDLDVDGELDLDLARLLVTELDTGDVIDPDVDGSTLTTESSAQLPRLMAVLAWAEAAGAIGVIDQRVVAMPAWDEGTDLDRAASAFEALLEIGAIALHGEGPDVLAEVDQLIDDGALPWMAMMLPDDTIVPIDMIDALVAEASHHRIDPSIIESLAEQLPTYLSRQTSLVLDTLVAAGVVAWSGRERIGGAGLDGLWIGGELSLTPLGRHLLPGQLHRIGMTVRTVEDPAIVTASELLDLAVMSALEPSDLAQRWWPDRDHLERIEAVVAAILDAPAAEHRIAGFGLLSLFDGPETAAPIVRQLLDSPVAGHAALFLLEHGLATDDEVGDFVDEGPLIDILGSVTHDPEAMADLFMQMGQRIDELDAVLERMWRHPADETAEVLDALGRHLPDKKLAKAARRVLVKHRSWMADPNR